MQIGSKSEEMQLDWNDVLFRLNTITRWGEGTPEPVVVLMIQKLGGSLVPPLKRNKKGGPIWNL